MTWTSLFAAIKGNSSPRFQDELMRSHPVAINGFWMYPAVQSCYQSAICVQLPDRSGTGVTEPTPQIGFWLCARPVVSDDWPLSICLCVVTVSLWSVGQSAACLMLSENQISWRRGCASQFSSVTPARWVQDILPPWAFPRHIFLAR